MLEAAARHSRTVLVWGAGTHQGYGHEVEADVVLSTHRLSRIVEWLPEDLTVVVEAGVTVADLEEKLAERSQTAVLPERPGTATVGGVIAAGVSGWRRLRYGPTRDRMLEVTLAAGTGRVVTGGGRVVKNVTGYDLPRLATGSLGAVGVIGRVCLKLWPRAESEATVIVDDAASALQSTFGPLAVIEDTGSARVYLSGSHAEVEAQAADLGGVAEPGLAWPEPLVHPYRFDLRVPSSLTGDAVGRLGTGRFDFQAAHGVGEVRLGTSACDAAELTRLRSWAESVGGSLVVAAAREPIEGFDPWGGVVTPTVAELQRRVAAAFDPARVVNPGRGAGRP